MKRELLIIAYKINVGGLSHQQAQESIQNLIDSVSIQKDEELIDMYIIREIFIPIRDGESDVNVIFPVPSTGVLSPDAYNLIDEMSEKIKEYDNDSSIKKNWNNLLRELKIKLLNNE